MAATPTATAATETEPRRRALPLLLAVAGLVAAGGFGLHWWTTGRYLESTDNAYLRADISALTPRVAGEIVALHVRDNQAVKAGELLLEIDPRDYAARVDAAHAAVAQAQAALAGNGQSQSTQRATIAEAEAAQAAALAAERQARQELERAQALLRDGVATRQRLDNAEAAERSARAQVARAEAGVQAARRQLASMGDAEHARLEAALAAAEAQATLAGIDLAATRIVAPVDGSVGDLAARLGERVQPNQRLLSLVPLDRIYLDANFKETQLRRMAVGQPAEIAVDAYPGQRLHGHVESLSPASGAEFALLPAQNATGNFTKIVQRVPVRIALDPAPELAGRLRPGLSVQVRVDTRGAAPR